MRGGYRLTLKKEPKLKAWGATFAEAEAEMIEQLYLHFGDGEALLDYQGPSPGTDVPDSYGVPRTDDAGRFLATNPRASLGPWPGCSADLGASA